MRTIIQKLGQFLYPQCKDISFLNCDQNIYSIHPIATMVRPWLGRHQVYGIFMLPKTHQLNYPILLHVKRAGKYKKEADMVKVNIDQKYLVHSSCYTLRVHLKTRVAILMIFQGLYSQLQNPINWNIYYKIR